MYKQVCRKIRASLVAGREEVVSPTAVCRSFLDSFGRMAPATSTDSGIFPGDGRENAPRHNTDCPFVEAAEGWTIEYSEKFCEVGRPTLLCTVAAESSINPSPLPSPPHTHTHTRTALQQQWVVCLPTPLSLHGTTSVGGGSISAALLPAGTPKLFHRRARHWTMCPVR